MSSNVEHARVLRQLKRYADAEAALRAHLADAPEDAEALSLLAQTLFQLKRYEEAIKTGRSAVAADPRSAEAYWALGLVLVVKFHDTEGIDVLNRGLALGPGHPGCGSCEALHTSTSSTTRRRCTTPTRHSAYRTDPKSRKDRARGGAEGPGSHG